MYATQAGQPHPALQPAETHCATVANETSSTPMPGRSWLDNGLGTAPSVRRSSRITGLLRRRQRSRLPGGRRQPGLTKGKRAHRQQPSQVPFARQSPVPARPAFPAAERRRFPRRQSRSVVRVLRPSDQPPTTPSQDWAFHAVAVCGELIDISMNGASFLAKEPLEVNSSIHLKLVHPQRDFSATRLSNVVRCESVNPGRWNVTCRFECCLTLDEVIQLGNAWT